MTLSSTTLRRCGKSERAKRRWTNASNGPTAAIKGRRKHFRGTSVGFRKPSNYTVGSLRETRGFRTRRHPESRYATSPLAPAPWNAVQSDPGASLAGGPPALPLSRGSLLLLRETATLRATRRTGRAARSGGSGECGDDDVAERLKSDLAVTQLRPLLRHSHYDRSRRIASGDVFDYSYPLLIAQRGRIRCHPSELYPTVRRIDVLPSRPGRPRKLPLQLRRRNDHVRCHFKIHATSVAHFASQKPTAQRPGEGGPNNTRHS